MATQTEVVTVRDGEDQANPDTIPEQNDSSGPKESGLRRRFKKKNGPKTRKPPGNKWLQQQIPACRPVFSANHVGIAFIIIGVVFIAMGIAFTVVSIRLREFEFSYTNCSSSDRPGGCEDYLTSIANMTNDERRETEDCHCTISISLPQSLRPPWNIYYGMDNYYQNHRRYLNSWDIDQLRSSGDDLTRGPSSDCRPLITQNGKPIVPCGLIANSWFNDSFDYFFGMENQSTVIDTIDRTNIAWDTDRSIRFRNPNGQVNISAPDINGTVRPPNWPKDLSEIAGGLLNESFIVWFRVSAFPLFRKLYGRAVVNGGEPGQTELPAGNYSLDITYNYPVSAFNGKKSIILAEVSALGGRNLFLGIAYLVVGSLLILAAVVLVVAHLLLSKWKTTDRNFLNRKY